jgi:superfamily I DNA/RNA helicase
MSEHKEYLVFGSPGTGKTTHLIRTIKSIYDRNMQDDMLLVSFTRTAAQKLIEETEKMLMKEAEKRGEQFFPIEGDMRNIGTLHAIAWRALGKPTIAETQLKKWNESHPTLKMGSSSAINVDDLDEMPTREDAPGEKLLADLNLLRSRMTPTLLYPDNVRQFAERWNEWKRETQCIDFTDMIYRAYRDVAYAPDKPRIMIADESQDFSKLQFELFRKWSQHTEYSILAGDDDQCSSKNTIITMGDYSLKSIADLKVGDVIRGFNPETEMTCNDIVLDINKIMVNENIYTVKTLSSETEVTSRHIWVVKHYGSLCRLCTDQLFVGMKIPVLQDDKSVEWENIVEIIHSEYNDIVYGLKIEHHQMYIADGIVTHNCLYSFTGATPEAFFDVPVPDEQKQILPQSYRLPKKILQYSDRWIHQVSHRQPKVIRGTDVEGEVLMAPPHFTIRNKDAVVKVVEKYVTAGKSVMVLATCSYMLNDIRAALKDAGIPFHNPYRAKRGDWNPIRKSAITQAMLSYLAYSRKIHGNDYRPWNTQDIASWAGVMRVKEGLVKHGASKVLKEWASRETPLDINTYEALEQVFEEDIVHQMIMNDPDLDFWYSQLSPDKAKSALYPLSILKKYGSDGLLERPNVILGTVHSVKGGEADVTILFGDLSRSGMQEWCTPGEKRDNILRTGYVGMTRSRETLILGAPSSNFAMKWL